MVDVRRALADDHPLALLALISSIVDTVDPRRADPFDRSAPDDAFTLETLVRSFAEIDRRETTAVLAGIAEMTTDDLLRARIRRTLDSRRHTLPVWLVGLADARAYRTVEMVHVLGDGDNIMIAVRLVGGVELSIVVYIDHNAGTLVKDAFVVPETIDKLIRFMKAKGDDVDTRWLDMDPADARARIAQAIATAAMTYPPFESDTWPMCRPLVEWAAHGLPEGGTGYAFTEWSEDALDAIADRFFASPFGAGLDTDLDVDGAESRDLLGYLLWFGSGYGPADPLRWSPVAVEILMGDWIPRKIVADADHLSRVPDVLRAFVRFCHAERGIRPSLTTETLEAVDHWEPEYQRIIRSPRPQGPEALLAAVGGFGHDDEHEDEDEDLAGLDTDPLPDEGFAWDAVADDIRPVVTGVLAGTDSWCDSVGDVEYRTACRRFLAEVATTDPTVFRGNARVDNDAAAVCWTVGQANEVFSPKGRGLMVKDLMAHFGLKGSVSQRAYALLRAGGFGVAAANVYAGIALGSPDYLVSARRQRIITSRDRMRAWHE